MAKTLSIFCTECKDDVEHWDNREGKRNPKAPDYKCRKCGKGIWEKSGYESELKPSPVIQEPRKERVGLREKVMVLSYAKDMAMQSETLTEAIEQVGIIYGNLLKLLEDEK